MIRDELLDAILAAPDDDAPRLVYADWLSERGDPRGEQIAVEIALARAALDAPDRPSLLERAAALRTSIGHPSVDGVAVEFRSARGMIEHAKLALDALLARADDLFDVAPLLRSVEVTNVDEPKVVALLERPWFVRLRRLEMSWHVPGDAVAAVARSAAARGLEGLSIHHAGLPEAAFAALGASEHLTGLRGLWLNLSGATDECVAALLSPGAVPSLTALGLSNNTIGTAGCEAVANHIGPLEHLDIGWNRLGYRGVVAIANSSYCCGLRHLDLDHVQTGEKGCAALAAAGLALERLNLSHSKVDDAGARRLIHSPSLPSSLRSLDLRGNTLSTDVAAELRACFGARVVL